MRSKTIVSGVAIALALSVGSAFAAEESILSGVQAEPLTAAEMEQVQGKWGVSANGGFLPGSGTPSGNHHPTNAPNANAANGAIVF